VQIQDLTDLVLWSLSALLTSVFSTKPTPRVNFPDGATEKNEKPEGLVSEQKDCWENSK